MESFRHFDGIGRREWRRRCRSGLRRRGGRLAGGFLAHFAKRLNRLGARALALQLLNRAIVQFLGQLDAMEEKFGGGAVISLHRDLRLNEGDDLGDRHRPLRIRGNG